MMRRRCFGFTYLLGQGSRFPWFVLVTHDVRQDSKSAERIVIVWKMSSPRIVTSAQWRSTFVVLHNNLWAVKSMRVV